MSFIRKTLTAAICLTAVGSVSADQYDPTGDFTDYFDGAMIVYVNKYLLPLKPARNFMPIL